MRISSNRPDNDSDNPFSNNTRLLPRINTLILRSWKVSSSHSFFTTSLQLDIFCISSMTRMILSQPLFSFRLRVAAQQLEIHALFVAGTLSAEKNWYGIVTSLRTCLTTVDFPICLAPIMTWINLLCSSSLLLILWYSAFLYIVLHFTQYNDNIYSVQI